MNDDQLSELILRANAYLDGELDTDEMIRAESDPAVMSEVEALRALQAELRTVAPASDTVRETMIATALREFDVLNAPTAATAIPAATTRSETIHHAARVVPFRPRPASARWLTAAAAVVAVGVLGVVVTKGLGGGSDDSESAGTAAQFDQDLPQLEQARSAEATANSDMSSSDMMEAEIAAAPVDAIDQAQVAGDALPGDSAADVGGAEPAEESFGIPAMTSPLAEPFDPAVPIADEATLLLVGQDLLARWADGTLGTTPETRCDVDGFEVLARGTYIDRTVIIAADPVNSDTGAYDVDTCELLASATAQP